MYFPCEIWWIDSLCQSIQVLGLLVWWIGRSVGCHLVNQLISAWLLNYWVPPNTCVGLRNRTPDKKIQRGWAYSKHHSIWVIYSIFSNLIDSYSMLHDYLSVTFSTCQASPTSPTSPQSTNAAGTLRSTPMTYPRLVTWQRGELVSLGPGTQCIVRVGCKFISRYVSLMYESLDMN